MLELTMDTVIDGRADDVWTTFCDFGAMDRYLPAIESISCEGDGVGAVRTLTFKSPDEMLAGVGRGEEPDLDLVRPLLATLNKGPIVERLQSLESPDERTRVQTYVVTRSPLPIVGIVDRITVTRLDDGRCGLAWTTRYGLDGVADEAARLFLGATIRGIFDEIARLHGGASAG